MKLSKKTMQILSNFAQIENSILIVPGNVIRTRNDYVFAMAQVEETFQHRMAIYDLAKFLGIVSNFDEPELLVENDRCVIQDGNTSFTYPFATEKLIRGVEKDIKFPDEVVAEFKIDKDELKRIENIKRIAGLPNIILSGKNGKCILDVGDTKVVSSKRMRMEVGEAYEDFTMVMSSESLRMLPGDYGGRVGKGSNGKSFLTEFSGNDVNYYFNGMRLKNYA